MKTILLDILLTAGEANATQRVVCQDISRYSFDEILCIKCPTVWCFPPFPIRHPIRAEVLSPRYSHPSRRNPRNTA